MRSAGQGSIAAPALALAALLAGACTDASSTTDMRGIWNVRSIGGHDVPGAVVYDDDSLAAEYVRWVFYDGVQCTLTQRVDNLTATYDECTYTVDEQEGTFVIAFQEEEWSGSVDGSRMTLTDPKDVVWILRSQ